MRFLAPFDPLVWDRPRFEHLWGWPNRFEAYVPRERRRLGYYAMPLSWGEDVVGWVNCTRRAGNPDIGAGDAIKRNRGSTGFARAFDDEAARLIAFLPPDGAGRES